MVVVLVVMRVLVVVVVMVLVRILAIVVVVVCLTVMRAAFTIGDRIDPIGRHDPMA